MDKLSWVFELVDKATQPLGNIEKALKANTDAIDKLNEKLGDHGDKVENAGRSHESFLTTLSSGINVLKTFGGALLDIGKGFADAAIDTISFKQNTMVALQAILGTKEAAKGMMDYGVKFAALTQLQTKDTIDYMEQLTVGAGADAKKPQWMQKDLPLLMSTVADASALMGNGAFGAQAATSFLMAAQQGTVEERFMGPMGQGKIFKRVFDEIATQRYGGVKALTGNATAIEQVFVDAVKQVTGGQESGTFSHSYANETIPGLLSTLKSRSFESMLGLDQTKGTQSMMGALQNLVAATDPDGPIGGKIRHGIETIFSDMTDFLFGGFSGEEGAAHLQAVLDKVGTGITSVGDIFKTGEMAAGAFFGGISRGFGESGDLFGKDGHLDPAKMDAAASAMGKLGEGIGKLATGLSGLVHPWETTKGFFTEGLGALSASMSGSQEIGLVAHNQEAIEEKLRSEGWSDDRIKKFEDSLPQHAAGGYVSEDHPAMVHKGEMIVPWEEVASSRNTSTTGSPSIIIQQLVVQVTMPAGSKDMDAKQLGQEIASALPEEMAQKFEEIAIEMGQA